MGSLQFLSASRQTHWDFHLANCQNPPLPDAQSGGSVGFGVGTLVEEGPAAPAAGGHAGCSELAGTFGTVDTGSLRSFVFDVEFDVEAEVPAPEAFPSPRKARSAPCSYRSGGRSMEGPSSSELSSVMVGPEQ